jgi:hypothetical protein
MSADYSVHPLFKKLGLKEGFQIKLIHPPENYSFLIGHIFDKLIVKNLSTNGLDFIHYFPKSKAELEKILPPVKTANKERRHDLDILV